MIEWQVVWTGSQSSPRSVEYYGTDEKKARERFAHVSAGWNLGFNLSAQLHKVETTVIHEYKEK